MPGDCPKGGYHDWENVHETETQVTHKCSKCQATNTRQKGKADQ